ncbi:hypothetical protein ACFYV7_24065 [Nocardia suismassiliense]|uniref:Uncharacterized protein n=1 Tax=Nocardia suismassiliense TaxID=2077092 RepID=A0ABW6QXM6_9NOCA
MSLLNASAKLTASTNSRKLTASTGGQVRRQAGRPWNVGERTDTGD